jgi:hypothetical protein
MKEHISLRLPSDTIERIRRTVDHHRGPPNFLTINLFVQRAVERELTSAEKKNGGPFPASPRKAQV